MEKPKYERIWDLLTKIYLRTSNRRKFFEQKLSPQKLRRGEIAKVLDPNRKISPTIR